MTSVAGAHEVLTPTIGKTAKRLLFWAVALVFVVILGIVSIVATGSASGGPPLASDNAGPTGAKAVAEVLRQQGVTVVATSSLDETREAIDSAANTTLFIYDADAYLDEDALRDAIGLAATVVLAEPDFRALQAAAPELAMAGYVNEVLEADCEVPVVSRSQSVSGTGSGYRLVGDPADVTPCLGSGDRVYSLAQISRADSTLIVLGATGALTNESVASDGNAAFALGLLGENATLVWYLPGFGDVEAANDETLAELTPGWVVPVMFLLVITFIVGAIWRGRRLGPLVVENLPVTVRSSETMLGRARLYEKSSSRLRALDSLRIGSVQRLAGLCGLPRTATVDDVIASVSSLTRAQPGDIRHLLIDAVPTTDRDLIAYSDALLTLEAEVARAILP